MTLRAVKTLSDDLAALGLPEDIVARARAYEADHRRLCAIERAAREYVDAIDAESDLCADEIEDEEVFEREADALAVMRDLLGRWS